MRILGNKLLLCPLPVQEKTEGGIILPQEQAGDQKMFWRVEQVGNTTVDHKIKRVHGMLAKDYAVGEIVITPLHHTHSHLEDGSGRRIVGCDQIEGKLEESNA